MPNAAVSRQIRRPAQRLLAQRLLAQRLLAQSACALALLWGCSEQALSHRRSPAQPTMPSTIR